MLAFLVHIYIHEQKLKHMNRKELKDKLIDFAVLASEIATSLSLTNR